MAASPARGAQVAAAVSRYEQRLTEAGGRKLSGIRLTPDAAAALTKLEQSSGQSATAIINRLLIQAGSSS